MIITLIWEEGYMVTFYKIHDIERFFCVIDSCVGSVFLKSSDGELVDIRRNVLVKDLLRVSSGKRHIEELVLTIEDNRDMPRIMGYLIGG